MVPTILIMTELDHANNLFLEKKFQDAITKYAKFLESNPDNLIALNNMGYALSKLKKFESAIECYNKSLELEPNDKIVLVNKISALRKTGKINDAIEVCDKLLVKNPKSCQSPRLLPTFSK